MKIKVITKIKTLTITIYFTIIKKITKNDSLIRRKLLSLKVVILAISSIFYQIVTFTKTTFFVKESISRQVVTFTKITFFAKKSTSHQTIISTKTTFIIQKLTSRRDVTFIIFFNN